MKTEAGSSAAVNPKTGETIALVSSPAYNPNIIVRGASKAQREAWSNDSKLPMTNRFTQAFVRVPYLKRSQVQLVWKQTQ